MKTIKHLLLLFFILFSTIEISASHMMGGDISYKWLGGKKYEFTFRIFRDCRGIAIDTLIINAYGLNNGTANVSMPLRATRISITDINLMCNDTLTKPCNPQNTQANEGVEEHVFISIIDLDSSKYSPLLGNGNCQIYISMEMCCRNGAITTISPGNFYIEATLNVCNSGFANSSPTFFSPGSLYAYCNNPFRSNFGAYDLIDNDSLVFELANPLNGYKSNEIYTGNFTKNIPLTPYCPPNPGVLNCRALPNAKPPRGFYFDSKTGDIVFTPSKCDEVSVVSIKITEYRKINGTWQNLGYVIRDVQFASKQGSMYNEPPEIDVKSEYVFKTRVESCFDIITEDKISYMAIQNNPGNVTQIKILNAPVGSSLSYKDSSIANKTGKFCWKVHDSIYHQLKNISKFIPITIEVWDNFCPQPRSIRSTVFLKVLPPDSAGFVQINTFQDKNFNKKKDNLDVPVKSKLLVENGYSVYSIESDTNGSFGDSFARGVYTFGKIANPYFISQLDDTSINVLLDSSYQLDFPMVKRNGIYGYIYRDVNQNCIFDSGDKPLTGYKVLNDSNTLIGMSNELGEYFISSPPKGNIKLHCQFKPFAYKVNCPDSNTIHINYNSDTIIENVNFGITANEDYFDVQTSLSSSVLRRGQSSKLSVYYKNKGNSIATNIKLYIPVPNNIKLNYMDSIYINGGDTLIIDIDSLEENEEGVLSYYFIVNPSYFNVDDEICFKVFIDSLTNLKDSILSNNKYKLCGRVNAPYDPNIKALAVNTEKTKFDTHIDYTIHFQNTGNDTAFRVMVVDTIDTRYLDLSQFEMNWSDANCEPYIVGNAIYFIFPDIRLPQLATSNEKSISGFGFRLGLKSNTSKEESFTNKASIYFDFEDAIVTKDAVCNIVSPIKITSLSAPSSCEIVPNTISFRSVIPLNQDNIYSVELSDINGNFVNSTILREKASFSLNDTIIFTPPANLSGNYKIRMRTSSPVAFGIPDSGVINFSSLLKPNYLVNSNINNNSLCQNDTLILDIISQKYAFKMLKNDVALSDFSQLKSFKFKLDLNDKFKIIAIDSGNMCVDTAKINLTIIPAPSITLQIDNPKNAYCSGDTLLLRANGGTFYSFYSNDKVIGLYSNKNTFAYVIQKNEALYAYGIDQTGCGDVSDLINITVNPLPAKPIILGQQNTLSISSYPVINWFRNGNLIQDTGKSVFNAQSGLYYVKVSDVNTCSNTSNNYTHFNTSVSDFDIVNSFTIFPNPANTQLEILNVLGNSFRIELYDISGKSVLVSNTENESMILNVDGLNNGLYTLVIHTNDGMYYKVLISIIH